MQIVNGRQTSEALAHASKEGNLQDDVRILVKIFATDDSDFVHKITSTTNNQNAVTSRDLASNHKVQRDIEKVMRDRFGHYYERKPRQFANLSKSERDKREVPNEKAGQAHIAAVLELPAIATSQKNSLWSKYSSQVFSAPVEQLLVAYKIYKYCTIVKKRMAKAEDADMLDEAIKRYGLFHLTYIIGKIEIGSKLVFSAEMEAQRNLSDGTVSEDLRQKLTEAGIPLSNNVSVSMETDASWLITSGDKAYVARQQGDELNIYGSKWEDTDFLEDFIQKLESNSDLLDENYREAYSILKAVLQEHKAEEHTNIFNVFKSTDIHRWLNDALKTLT